MNQRRPVLEDRNQSKYQTIEKRNRSKDNLLMNEDSGEDCYGSYGHYHGWVGQGFVCTICLIAIAFKDNM